MKSGREDALIARLDSVLLVGVAEQETTAVAVSRVTTVIVVLMRFC